MIGVFEPSYRNRVLDPLVFGFAATLEILKMSVVPFGI